MPEAIRKLDVRKPAFEDELDALLRRDQFRDRVIFEEVASILETVRTNGDRAVLEYTNLFDKRSLGSAARLEITDFDSAVDRVDNTIISALRSAADRIRIYHERQGVHSWEYEERDGTKLGQLVNPLSRVGIYVPGGKAAYPSSVLMNAIPAKIAGVKKLVMVTPTPNGVVNPLV